MTLTKFLGREVARQITNAVEAIPEGREIVTFKAGENMPITAALAPQYDIDSEGRFDPIPEYAWDGERWTEIGWL